MPIIEILRGLLQFVLKVQIVQIIGLLEILNIISVYLIINFVVLNNCTFTVFFLLLEVDILKNTILNWLSTVTIKKFENSAYTSLD